MDNNNNRVPNKLSKSFHWLNVTQFLGALNDNILKLLMVFFLIGQKGPSEAGIIAAKAGAVFVLPFLLFSSFAGVLADRISKQRIIVAAKFAEVAVTIVGTASFLLGSEAGLFVVLFMMATHSALFAPSKYGIVPELVKMEQLSLANGRLESFTYFAIILGTGIACFLVDISNSNYATSAVFCIGIAFLGLAAAVKIEKTHAVGSTTRSSAFFVKDIFRSLKEISSNHELLLAVLGSAYFTFLAAFTQINIIPYGMETLSLTQEKSGYLFLVAALGIGAGALLTGKLCGKNIEFGVVPLGALGLTIAAIALHFVPPQVPVVLVIVFLIGLSAGLFIVPLLAFIQMSSPKEKLGAFLAASVFLNWVGVLLASGLAYFYSAHLQLSASKGFMILGLLTMVLTVITLKTLPDFLVRFLAVLLTRLCYRIRIIGGNNVPQTGPALLVSNHVTWVDALFLAATQQRRIRFIMERSIYNNLLLKPFFKVLGVIPVSSKDSRKQIISFLREAKKALDDGYMVCIFAEGIVTRNGMLGTFRPGFEKIVRGTGYPVIPAYIGGAWGSIFSYAHGKLMSRLPAKFPYPVTILFGKPCSSESGPLELKQAVTELSCDYFDSLKTERKSLGEFFVRSARKHWGKHAISDTIGKTLSYGHALTGAIALSDVLRNKTNGQDMIGILLPPSAGAVLANLAVVLLNKIPVNLNYTASLDAFQFSIQRCNIKTVITSKVFLEKVNTRPASEHTVFVEDLVGRISPSQKRAAWIKARFAPIRFLAKKSDFHADDLATIIFSSGSTGEPKGVMLSHHNIVSNIEALRMVFRVTLKDNVCSALPFFHSLGFTGTLWFPLLSGFSVAYHVNPLDGAKIAEVVRDRRSTILLATPTFLLTYIRKAAPEDFKSLRLVATGAEKLKKRVADSFEERFRIRPLEGYGATELSPVISLNVPDVEIDGVRQKGSREGGVGHPIPGVILKVVDIESEKTLAPGETGQVMVKGPNMMLGYFDQPDLTTKVLHDGWYVTGDIGWMDDDGFLTITDRLARFSKIGGEMVPHIAIEEELYSSLNLPGNSIAVTSLIDEKKGEKLVVLYVKGSGDSDTFRRTLDESALPNLWKPDRNCYLEIDALPILGSGKLDIAGLRQIAKRAVEEKKTLLQSV